MSNMWMAAAAALSIGWAGGAAAQAFPDLSAGAKTAPVSADVEAALDRETERQHQRRVQAYEQLKGKLDMSINASAEARNLAVGSALQMVTPITDVKVQRMQQQQGFR